MEKKSASIAIVGSALMVVYGIGLLFYMLILLMTVISPDVVINLSMFKGQYHSIEQFQGKILILLVLFAPQVFAFWGISKLRDWGRKLILVMSVVMCVYVISTILVHDRMDTLSAISILIYIILFFFFIQPNITKQFAGVSSSLKKILIVDDDKALCQIVKKSLTDDQFIVYSAYTGEKCLKLAKSKQPDLIVLDVILPGMKGRQVCEKLKEDSRKRDIPVIFLTAKDSPDDVKAEIEAGGLTHFTKPIEPKTLTSEIKKILGIS